MTITAPPQSAPPTVPGTRKAAILLRDLVRCFALYPDSYEAPAGVTYREIVDAYSAAVRAVDASSADESYVACKCGAR